MTKVDTVVNALWIHQSVGYRRSLHVIAALLSLTGLLWLAPASVSWLLQPVHGAPDHHPLLQAQQTTPALVSAASGIVPLGGISVTLAVSVSNVVDLGAASVELGYDPTLVTPVRDSCYVNRALFNGGTCNLRLDRNNDGIPDAVRFNVYSLTQSGVSVPGNVPSPMVQISWVVTESATAGAASPLTVTVRTFDNASAVPIPVIVQHGQLAIAAPPSPTATPLPSATPAANTPTSTPIPTPFSTPAMTPTIVSPTPTGVHDAAIFLPVVASP